MVTDDIWVLIGKKVSAEATPQELLELESFIAENEAYGPAIANLEQLWRVTNAALKPATDIEKKWEQFRLKISPAP